MPPIKSSSPRWLRPCASRSSGFHSSNSAASPAICSNRWRKRSLSRCWHRLFSRAPSCLPWRNISCRVIMSQPPKGHEPSAAAPSRNPFVRFQKAFERRFDQFREGYGRLLERAIEHRNMFVKVALIIALGSTSLFFFLGRDYFPEIPSGVIQMHMRAPLGTRIEVSGRLATLVSNSIEELLPGQVENIVSNCGLPVGPHNLAFIPTPTIGSQDCDLTILLKDEKSPVSDYRRLLRKGLKERYPSTEFTFQPSDRTAKTLHFGAPAPIDVQINGMDIQANYEFVRNLAGELSTIDGTSDVTIQQTMHTPTLFV